MGRVTVNAGDRLVVTVSSAAFDPVVAVTPPGGGQLSNDDWQGSREHAHPFYWSGFVLIGDWR